MHIIIDTEQIEKLFAKLDSLQEMILTNKESHQKEWLTSDEVLKTLNISSRTLQNYRDSGKIGFTQIGSRKIYYSKTSVIQLLEKNYNKPIK